jgi:hypothetical protein
MRRKTESEYNLKKSRIVTVLMIMLTTMFTFTTLLPIVRAINVEITSIEPTSGKVGDTIQIVGTINKTGGLYRIWFDRQKVKETNATGNTVNANFSVPAIPKGNYTITLQDVENNINATAAIWFYVETAYYIKTIMMPNPPEQLQENSTVRIQVDVTGGGSNTIYSANITVKVPTPANETYWTLATLTNTTDTGNGTATVAYPNDFHGTPHTNYTGTYAIAFNKTATTVLATNTFTIGLTNSTEYHRRQLVDIKAAGYKSNENITIKINFGGKTIDLKANVNATEGGLILAEWPVPLNASIGTYTVNITSTSSNPTRKTTPDIQNFIIPGFDVNITTRNLAQEIVANVTIQVFENETYVLNANTTSDGLAQMKLEIGNYTGKAYYKEENVGQHWINITNAASLDFSCNLTNLKISVTAVLDGHEVGVPEVKIYLTPENKIFTTDIDGTTVEHSLLPNVNYTLNVTRYGVSFHVTKISTLLVNGTATAWYNVTIICPTFTLRVNVTDANSEPINNAIVKVRESMGGLNYENTTVEGIAIFNCTFGNYTMDIYDTNGIKLNETNMNLFQNRNISISCKLYGLIVSIKVVDYFGQPISNANVTLQRESLASLHHTTQPDGVATFSSITGGNLQIAVYVSDQTHPCVAEWLFVDSSKVIEIKLEKYIVLAGFLVETSSLITTIIIAATVLLVLLIEVYRRKRLKSQKSSS